MALQGFVANSGLALHEKGTLMRPSHIPDSPRQPRRSGQTCRSRRFLMPALLGCVLALSLAVIFCPALQEAKAFLARPGVAAISQPSAALGGSVTEPLALGSADQNALRTQNVQQGSGAEKMLEGSFLGSLLFGTPYDGIGSVDIIILVLLGYLTARLLNGRRGNTSETDRFDARSRSDSTLHFPERDKPFDRNTGNDRAGQPAPEDRANEPDHAGETYRPKDGTAPNTPTDNAWTRKMGGQGAAGSARPVRVRPTTVKENAAAMWEALSGAPVEEELPAVAPGVQLPRGFDVKDFLEGARVLYSKLQTAWASRELESLIPFTTPEMMLLLQKQAAKNPEPSTVDIVLVNAELEQFRQENGQDMATVLFHVTMRFGDNASAEVIDEIWHFVRASSGGGMWQLSGIDAA